MGKDIKQLKNRIKSVDSSLHLTKAMGLVASAKIRSASNAMNNARQYASAIGNTVNLLTQSKECEKSVYMKKRESGSDCIIVIAGDRGLAGGYNSNIFKMASDFSVDDIIAIGKRASEKFGKEILSVERLSLETASKTAKKICNDFKEGKYKSVKILSTSYISMMTQVPEVRTILPLEKSAEKSNVGIIFEPDEITVLENVLEEYVTAKLIEAVKESFMCEVVARRFAMDSARKNAEQMIETLQHEYNRARQGAITQEITEIVAGSGV